MRRWWKWFVVHDLISMLKSLPESTPEDEDSIYLLESCLKGSIDFPRYSKELNILTLDDDGTIYALVLDYIQDLWSDIEAIHSNVAHSNHGTYFMGRVCNYSHIFVDAIQYGAATHNQGKKAKYAYILGRIAVEIQ
ncbi:hypothetical protein SERLA73DRAFT_153260 [Serpula lacrymans var. lacrymans S7.3]|uniref:Fungal-type protein kinase domain-containing protein n=1 Tax=Serpula lacrymans var. lacrymans (strain S7.3) TaxID=936435 RepID=F8Q191_SERL3|nr:hypothetical protein SERLA73DRAFT_153260 [Serpula lacrymans var. lacrymans S7.3]